MVIPKNLLNTTIQIYFSDETIDTGIVSYGNNSDYLLEIVVASVEFDKADVLEVGEGFIRVNFAGHETSTSATMVTTDKYLVELARLIGLKIKLVNGLDTQEE